MNLARLSGCSCLHEGFHWFLHRITVIMHYSLVVTDTALQGLRRLAYLGLGFGNQVARLSSDSTSHPYYVTHAESCIMVLHWLMVQVATV